MAATRRPRSTGKPSRRTPVNVEIDNDPERRQANRQIGKALRAIQSVRVFFITVAAANAILGVFLFLVTAAGGSAHFIYWPFVIAAIFAVGAFRIAREPRLWSLLGTVAQTGYAVLFPGLLSLLLAAGCWAAVLAILPAVRLVRQYPELRISRKVSELR